MRTRDERDPSEPAGSVALVTGSARGLGLAVARALRARGDRVHVVARRAPSVGSDGERALAHEFDGRLHRADLCEPGAATTLVRNVLARDGRIDWVVHAVGEYHSSALADADGRDLRRMLASNVESSFEVFSAARAALRASRGAALFFGCAGLDGLRARRETAIYAAAKSALLVLVKSWAVEEAAHGVRVNALSPGLIPHEHAAADTLDEARLARIPAGRPGTVEEIAAAALYLCSSGASYTTGADLPVGGGWML